MPARNAAIIEAEIATTPQSTIHCIAIDDPDPPNQGERCPFLAQTARCEPTVAISSSFGRVLFCWCGEIEPQVEDGGGMGEGADRNQVDACERDFPDGVEVNAP